MGVALQKMKNGSTKASFLSQDGEEKKNFFRLLFNEDVKGDSREKFTQVCNLVYNNDALADIIELPASHDEMGDFFENMTEEQAIVLYDELMKLEA